VVLAEQHDYPRQKVCGECIAAGNLDLIDELGIGPAFRRMAGAELRQVGWMGTTATIVAEFPVCTAAGYRFGRALGRDQFDSLLLERARSVGVRILQPAKVRTVRGETGRFDCDIEMRVNGASGPASAFNQSSAVSAAIIIDAHGSWEAGPSFALPGSDGPVRAPRRASDLFAFKARFQGSTLAPGLLPVLAIDGGYGGIVVADNGRTTVACCIRRDALQACRVASPGAPAGVAVEAMLRRSCLGIREVLHHAEREGSWSSVGPLRPGMRLSAACGVFRVGNAAGETHPLIGEGISMALQSAKLLVAGLSHQPVGSIDARRAADLQRDYAHAWSAAFASRLRLAALYAHLAMRPALATPVHGLLRRWPTLLADAARFAGKARRAIAPPTFKKESI
jgi:flavin-dependent dehydrogenase